MDCKRKYNNGTKVHDMNVISEVSLCCLSFYFVFACLDCSLLGTGVFLAMERERERDRGLLSELLLEDQLRTRRAKVKQLLCTGKG